jgi:hypothetical protein
MSYYPIRDQIDPFIPISEDSAYKPKQADYEKIKDYKDIE